MLFKIKKGEYYKKSRRIQSVTPKMRGFPQFGVLEMWKTICRKSVVFALLSQVFIEKAKVIHIFHFVGAFVT